MLRVISKYIAILLFVTLSNAAIAEDKTAEINVYGAERGALWRVLTESQPIWVVFRTKEAIQEIEGLVVPYDDSQDSTMLLTQYRSLKKDYFVVYGGCPNGNELPTYDVDSGFSCQNSCNKYDLAGRPINKCAGDMPMKIPEHYFKDATTIVVYTN